jgi:hypothetical protein
MSKRNFATLDEFKKSLHREGATLVEFAGNKIPCLLVNPKEYDDLLRAVFGKTVRVEPVLDIFYDGRDVFVDVQIKFTETDFDRNYLLYANGMMEFFEALAENGLLGIAPDSRAYTNSENIFTIQLAKKDAAEKALDIIREQAKRSNESAFSAVDGMKKPVEHDDEKVPAEIDSHFQKYGKHAWEVEYGEPCPTCNKRIDEFGFCACGAGT